MDVVVLPPWILAVALIAGKLRQCLQRAQQACPVARFPGDAAERQMRTLRTRIEFSSPPKVVARRVHVTEQLLRAAQEQAREVLVVGSEIARHHPSQLLCGRLRSSQFRLYSSEPHARRH